jgi:DNA modification methylase
MIAEKKQPYPMAQRMELWPIEKLIPYAKNPRTHSETQVAQIAASIAEFGFLNPMLVDTQAGLLAGHGRLLAAQRLELKRVPVIVLDHLTETQKRAYLLADNQLALNAGWDMEMLRVELEGLRRSDFDLEVIGFDINELAEVFRDFDFPVAGLTDEDSAPEPPEKPISQPGDLWHLGHHRLLCADATQPGDVGRLMGGEKADLVFSDCPYNVDYEGYTEDHLKILGDRMTAEQFGKFLQDSFRAYRSVVKPAASLYICHPCSWQREFQNALEAAGLEIRCQIIWAKNTFAWGFGRYKFQHEPIFYCHVAGESDAWYGDKSQSTLWQENKPAANRLHPTMKPVELIERAIHNSSRARDLVLDLFGGSGSTLIACERQGRRARLMEIDPRYCDVIVRRWEAFTGKTARLDEAKGSLEEAASERVSVGR